MLTDLGAVAFKLDFTSSLSPLLDQQGYIIYVIFEARFPSRRFILAISNVSPG